MYSYIKGKVVDINFDSIVVDNNGIGYLIHVSNPYSFKRDDNTLIYIHQQVKEDDLTLFGFKSSSEKSLFLKLIKVKGIGCKTAIGILATGDEKAIISAIESSNETYLKKIPGIGVKAAKQIILDLQGKFDNSETTSTLINSDILEATEVLIALGYNQSTVDKAMAKLMNEDLDTSTYVKKALSIIVK